MFFVGRYFQSVDPHVGILSRFLLRMTKLYVDPRVAPAVLLRMTEETLRMMVVLSFRAKRNGAWESAAVVLCRLLFPSGRSSRRTCGAPQDDRRNRRRPQDDILLSFRAEWNGAWESTTWRGTHHKLRIAKNREEETAAIRIRTCGAILYNGALQYNSSIINKSSGLDRMSKPPAADLRDDGPAGGLLGNNRFR